MKTTNSGVSWFAIATGTQAGWLDIHFVDSLTGWRCSPFGMKKTTDGGFNWVTEILPYGGIIQTNGIGSFSVINRDTLWGNGGYVLYPNNRVAPFLNRTTDGGNTWFFQIPDTSIHYIGSGFVRFYDKLRGWAYDGSSGIHTITGGDTIWYTGIQKINNKIPKVFRLFQNYPNPFNPVTIINYELKIKSNVKIIVYDITGKEVITLVNQIQNAGVYQVDFSDSNLSSGVYFYRIQAGEFVQSKKMVLIK